MSNLITVFGSTGNQGGSVIRAILAHPHLSQQWKIRGVTRDPSKPNAQALTAKGVEMVQADLNSTSSLLTAITSSTAVFGVTNYWETQSAPAEIQQGKNLADACKAASVQHLIWSSLPHVSKVTHGALSNLHHFDSKALIEEYITSINLPASFVLAGFFMSNITSPAMGMLKSSGDGDAEGYEVSLMVRPDTAIPLLDVPRDYGKFVAACLASPASTQGKHVLATSEWATPLGICEAVEKVRGGRCVFEEIREEKWPGTREMFENMLMIKNFAYYGPNEKEAMDGVEKSWGIVEEVGGFEEFGTFERALREVDGKAK